ncbi:MAG: CHASE2 domain-containing protein [Candidatus Omnitrophica bacterium]|nr:CHASE2 domain-containing protein [Candidatus Omnitrophota bacterium]
MSFLASLPKVPDPVKKIPPPGFLKREDNLFTRKSRDVISLFRNLPTAYLYQLLGSVLILIFYLGLLKTSFFVRFENVIYDSFFRLRPSLASHPSVVYIQIAEDSIQDIGRWPWPRHYHAVMTHILSEWQAKAIVFDMLFTEPSTEFDDGALEEAMATSQSPVYLPVLLENRKGEEVWVHSLPRFESHAKGVGHVNGVPDSDGVIRRIHPYLQSESEIFPHLALRLAYDYAGLKLPPEKKLPFPRDSEGNVMVNYPGKWVQTFNHISYRDLLKSFQLIREGKPPIISPEVIKGKICLIGLTATGLWDIKANPIEAVYPAIGVNGTVIQNSLQNQFISPANYALNAICLAVIGMVAIFCFHPFRNFVSFLAGSALALGWGLTAYFFFAWHGRWLYVFHPILLILTLFIFTAIYNYTIGKRERTHLFKLATRDGLTGLFVIRYFREILNKAVQDSHIQKQPLSLLILDIDDFKKINDTYGHLAGDKVLKEVSHIIHSCSRSKRPFTQTDYVARYGGEEFMVMLRGAAITESAFKIANRIRKKVEDTAIKWEHHSLRFTVSIGIASLGPEEALPDPMVSRADEALYRAKREGKNRVCLERLSLHPFPHPSVDQIPPAA